ncbi:hypothetical protein HanRHA438_Chr09g0424401 [Helianthus annuus]|nr:hypothetical protein HanLR1_Chr09g0338821 [Helianthus annuus]KAJ0890493.1 hypothetical protein HanRHA438_Chr09g0424401 [Helianthus annuus]KAJ0895241.1 hypothetical protein HanPSC8_Chr09g0398211 [Helianthus annuus]
MTFRVWSEPIVKEDLTVPKNDAWYQKLTPTPNRVFGENVLVAARMSDQWLPVGVFKTGYPKFSDARFQYPNPYPKFRISEIRISEISDTDSDSESDIRKSNFLFNFYFLLFFFIFGNGYFG